MNTIVTEQEDKGFYLAQVKNSDLAIFSYYVQSEKEAIIIDPLYDTHIYQEILKKRQAKLKAVFMTHYHADFISGHLEFKVPLIMGQKAKSDKNKYQIIELKEGQSYKLGTVALVSIHTPGHTPEGATYLLKNSQNKNVCLFTGDTLFLGDVGRPDLSTEQGLTKIDLAGMLFDSLQKLKKYQNQLRIYPAHGAGSACGGKKIDQGNFDTLGHQKQKNYALKIEGKNQFITKVVQDIDKPPKYYFHDAKINKQGPNLHEHQLKESNIPLSIEQFEKLSKNAKIFDTRPNANQTGLIKGSYWTHGKGPITSWIPMVAKPEDEILLVVEQGKGKQTVERLLRLGYFKVKGFNNFKVNQYSGELISVKVLSAQQVLQIKDRNHLDVRNKDQWKKTGVIQGAITIPLKKLEEKYKQVPHNKNLIVNCKTGMRARFAQSILARHGVESIVIAEKVQQLANKGFKMVPFIEEQKQEK